MRDAGRVAELLQLDAVLAHALGELAAVLLLLRTMRRQREVAVRIALGAPAWYVIRQVVSEGARLAAAGERSMMERRRMPSATPVFTINP